MKKIFTHFATVITAVLVLSLTGCLTIPQTIQYGEEGNDTIALNLTKDPNVGNVYVTHVNGVATGAAYSPSILGFGGKEVNVNPIYVKLTKDPIIFTIKCPVATGRTTSLGAVEVTYKTTELRLTKVSNLKPGDVLTLRWMYQTNTFAFIDATGNIVQQTIPTFN